MAKKNTETPAGVSPATTPATTPTPRKKRTANLVYAEARERAKAIMEAAKTEVAQKKLTGKALAIVNRLHKDGLNEVANAVKALLTPPV